MQTTSESLVQELDEMMMWRHADYKGLDLSDCPDKLVGIIREMEEQGKQIQVSLGPDGYCPQYKKAAECYAREVAHFLQEDFSLPVDHYRPPMAPWS
jgi:hypothetical protein